MLYERIKKEQLRLEKELSEIESVLTLFPPGKLICCHDHSKHKFYQSDGHSKTYIPKTNQELIHDLAVKKYLTCKFDELTSEKRALEFYLRHHSASALLSEKLLTEDSAYRELLSDYFRPLDSELAAWAAEPFPGNPYFPEHLIHKTASGRLVRSKSEAMIDYFLFTNKIPFRYECELELCDRTLYPDFTIRHPQTGEYYYWEHFGKMDDPEYNRKAMKKLNLYSSNGIYPDIQLITTYETLDDPLSTEVIQKIVEHYFL